MMNKETVERIAKEVGYQGIVDEDLMLDFESLTEYEVRSAMVTLIDMWK